MYKVIGAINRVASRVLFTFFFDSPHCLRALRILNLTGVILRHLLLVVHKSGTKNILFSKTVHFLQVQVQVLYCFTAVILK